VLPFYRPPPDQKLEDLSGAVDDTLYEFKCGEGIGYGILESCVIVA